MTEDTDEVIQRALDGLRPLPHRMETIHDDGRVRIVDDSACNNAPALKHLLDQLTGPVRLLTLNRDFDVGAFAGRVRVTRLGRDELERRLAPVLQDLLAELERDGGTLAYAPGVPITGGDPAAYMELFADAVRERW